MEGKYEVYFGNKVCGWVEVIRQGLYLRFRCRCHLSGAVVCRLYVKCGGASENLGVLAPVGEVFGLDARLSAKRLGQGTPEFSLVPKHELHRGTFVPICPEEPFQYLSRLKNGYLARQNGKAGVIVR